MSKRLVVPFNHVTGEPFMPVLQTGLKVKIMSAKLTQYKLAELVGMTETRMSRIIRGRIEPTREERKKIAQELNTSEADLFT